MKKLLASLLAILAITVFLGSSAATAAQEKTTPVTDENYSLAETDGVIEGYVKKIAKATNTNGVGVLMHYRKGADPKDRTIMRINFDTIYSWAIVDLTEPATLTMPETNGRYQSAWFVSEDGYYPGAFTTPGEHKITKEWVGGARYAVIVMRTQVDTKDPADLAKAHALQDKLKLTQKNKGTFVPQHQWNEKEVLAMRAKYMKIGNGMSTSDMFGKKGEISLKNRNAGNAFGWGGFTPDQAVYPQYFPKTTAPQTLTLKDVPVKAFWSITVYDKDGFPQTDTYNINSAFAVADADGSVTIHFGGDKSAKNYMETFDGWNFTLRMYQPTEAYFNETWKKPELKLVK
ncbi:MAG: DUF1254 domain-containing protein [Desulfuromonadales bacterium]|nr:DUF1254 domain-containing protein [Desulfuromonadales bacterium]